jgi:hypothetical protein
VLPSKIFEMSAANESIGLMKPCSPVVMDLLRTVQ